MLNKLKVILWAALHSPDFKYCYLKPLVEFHIRVEQRYPAWVWHISIWWRSPLTVYVPWSVQNAYNLACKGISESEYDDIPF
jgi:hypothetical protein